MALVPTRQEQVVFARHFLLLGSTAQELPKRLGETITHHVHEESSSIIRLNLISVTLSVSLRKERKAIGWLRVTREVKGLGE